MKRVLLGLMVLLLFSHLCHAQAKEPGGGGIVYGDNLAVITGAPDGWVLDNESGVNQGVHAVFYPTGSSWAKAPEVMYINIALLNGKSLDAFMATDEEAFRKNSATLKTQKLPPIKLSSGETAEVRLFTGDMHGNYECIAYASKFDSVAMYVLSCRSKEGFEKALPAFRSLVTQSMLAKRDH